MHTIQLSSIDSEEVYRSESGGTTEEHSTVTMLISGTPTENDVRRFAEDALTDKLGYLGVVQRSTVGNQRTVYGLTLIDATFVIQKEW